MPKVYVLLGPTGVGKTDLALQLAEYFPLTLINVDSTLVYRGMDIGTAKPSAEQLKKVPHELIDICDVTEVYSAGQFCKDARKIIAEVLEKQRIPLLVGGTMMYLNALQFGLDELPPASVELRQTIHERAIKEGWPNLHAWLSSLRPERAQAIHPHDAQRIQRALEIALSPAPSLTNKPESKFEYENFLIIPRDRDRLRVRLAQRFEKMLASGLVDEVNTFFKRSDVHPNLPAMRAVGYRQVWQYLEGKVDFETMKIQTIHATAQLAKRQLTWLKRFPDGTCLIVEQENKLEVLKQKIKNCMCL